MLQKYAYTVKKKDRAKTNLAFGMFNIVRVENVQKLKNSSGNTLLTY